ncbi:MAG: ATP-dependent DNA helicase RecG, partial [bacterium]|nr:ATP-dependent DNA helicase RecG [bacterium]
IFDDRVELISPGRLPNNLTVEKIKRGVSVKRNHTLASFAFDIIPYRGVGSGILRALNHYPHIEFINDIELDQFKAIIKRPPPRG